MKKIILITGSTDGIGKLAAIKLAKAGHTIYIHGRNSTKLSTVISEIKTISNNENIKGFIADFSDLEAVKQMAEQVKNETSKIDVLINNAGVFNSSISHNKDGLDIRYVVNYLAAFLLTESLMPLLKNGTATRIINLSSAAQDTINYDTLSGKHTQSERATYGQSKLALTMWSFDLAQQLQNITVIPVNPGSLLDTNMVREAFGQVWSSADKGADILYNLAVGKTFEGVTGKYFDNDRGSFGKAHSDAYDDEKIKKLMTVTRAMLS